VDSNHERASTDAPDVRWRVTTATGVQFVCRVYIIGAGIEVRLTSDHDELVCAKAVATLDAATDVVRDWLRTIVADDGIETLIRNASPNVVH